MKLKKLDKRMTGYGFFKYSVEFPAVEAVEFAQVRQWCHEQWGPTSEIDIWHRADELKNPQWCWERGEFNKAYRCRIFLTSDKEAEWFSLRWL